MKLEHHMTYDASPEQVFEMLKTPEFREKVCEHQRVLRHEVDVTPTGEGMDVHVTQVQSAKGVPGFAKKIVGDEITIEQKEHWTSPREGDLTVEIPGKPGRVQGTIRLVEDGDGTREEVDVDVRASIPLVGGKLEQLIADMLTSALTAEEKEGRAWLS